MPARLLLSFVLLWLVAPAVVTAPAASACPSCKMANEESDTKGVGAQTVNAKPRAYMVSILFMIGMPLTIFSGFGFAFYRMVRKAQLALNAEAVAESEFDPLPSGDGQPAAE